MRMLNVLTSKFNINTTKIFTRSFGAKIIGLPFKICPRTAINILEKNEGLFETNIKDKNNKYSQKKLIRSYIPIHTASIENLQSSFVGEFGNDRTEYYLGTESNGKGGYRTVLKSRIVTDWENITGMLPPTEYNRNLENKSLHIYGDFEFPKEFIKKCLIVNEPKSSYQEIDVDYDTKVFPHNMNFSMAIAKIFDKLRSHEKNRAADHIIQIKKSDHSRVSTVSMKMENVSMDTFSYHMPAYLYIETVDGKKVCKIINGYNGSYAGDYVTSVLKIGISGTVAGAILGAASFIIFPAYAYANVTRIVAMRIGLSTVGGGLFSTLSSYFYTKYQYESSRQELLNGKKENEGFEETLDDLERRSLSGTSGTTINAKFKKFTEEFEILELSFNEELSLSLLRDAKIKQLKKWHPDIYKGNKDLANTMILKINDAYEKLYSAL